MTYYQQATEKTPEIVFDWDKRVLKMEGNSRPEDVQSFFYPLLEMIEETLQKETKSIEMFTASFTFGYFNSASAKFIFDLILLLKGLNDKCKSFVVEWYYESGDVDMKEAGEDFSEMVGIPFEYIVIAPGH